MTTYYVLPNENNELELLQIFLNLETGGFIFVPVLAKVTKEFEQGNGLIVDPSIEQGQFKFLVPNKINIVELGDICAKLMDDKFNLLDSKYSTIFVLASDHNE